MTCHVTILLGGLMGFDGWIPFVNSGLWNLKDELDTLPGVSTSVFAWNDWQTAGAAIEARNRNIKQAIVGYSGGGSRATWLTNQFYRVPINSLVLWDPSPAWQMQPIKENVRGALCFHNQNPMFFGYGGGKLTGAAPIYTHEISQWHMAVQYSAQLHAWTVETVRNL